LCKYTTFFYIKK